MKTSYSKAREQFTVIKSHAKGTCGLLAGISGKSDALTVLLYMNIFT
ncbi:MAG: hypothetical protein ACI4TW_03945 [Prevotella sp.]